MIGIYKIVSRSCLRGAVLFISLSIQCPRQALSKNKTLLKNECFLIVFLFRITFKKISVIYYYIYVFLFGRFFVLLKNNCYCFQEEKNSFFACKFFFFRINSSTNYISLLLRNKINKTKKTPEKKLPRSKIHNYENKK